jgi:hypothetical protein
VLIKKYRIRALVRELEVMGKTSYFLREWFEEKEEEEKETTYKRKG